MNWISTADKKHPDKAGIERYEQILCLVVHGGNILLRQWNCEHLVWDTEDGDDYFCNADDVSYWMPCPALPQPKESQ